MLRRMSDIAMRRGDLVVARDYAEQAIAANPLDANSHNNAATVLLAGGDVAQATMAARRASDLAPQQLEFARRLDYLNAMAE
jgi:Tfp pilus assembly protein PilF